MATGPDGRMKHQTILTEPQLAEARTVKCAEIQELEQILAEKRTQLRRLFELSGTHHWIWILVDTQDARAVNILDGDY